MAVPVNSPFNLGGRRIVITGAAGGIGSATARLCAEHGASLILTDRLSPQAIAKSVGDATAAEYHTLDVTDREAVFRFAATIGPVYGLIDAAGICPLDDWMASDWDESL